jgi:hypothetical protein
MKSSISVWEQMNAAMSRYLFIQLEVGLTFAQAATQASWTEDVLHNRRLARRSYDRTKKLLQHVPLTGPEAHHLLQQLRSLESALRRLGDSLQG